ncbi:MAG: SIS domain-containing protein [Candidatus Omnitrophica bacterium]|nr:SIS domain-containing protein [Candidatus Omnitrophota bacterium]
MSYANDYLKSIVDILNAVDRDQLEEMIALLLDIRKKGGRLFFIGVGGSAANCAHAVNDFRKIGGFEAYSPVDNVAELTARANDEGWSTIFSGWLKGSRLNANDGIMVFSVGGGNKEKNISTNIVEALEYAQSQKAKIFGIVGRTGGYTPKVADVCIVMPASQPNMLTPQAEAFQAIIWHMIVSDPRVMVMGNKWETTLSAK